MKAKTYKRITALLLGGLMLTGTFGMAKADGEDAEIYWFSSITGWGPANWNGTDSSPLTDAIHEKYGATFQIEQPPTDANTKLGLMIATGDLPDVISLADADIIKELIASDMVYDMNSFLEEYAPDSHLLTDFPEDVKATLTDAYGGWYSIPSHIFSADNREVYKPCDDVYYDVATKASNAAIMFNKTMMDELGITQEDVQTEEGFYAACEKVKNSGYEVNGQSAVPVMMQGNLWIDQTLDTILSYNFGALPVDEDGNYRHTELSPGYKNALKFMYTCLKNGYLDKNALTIDENAMRTYVESGRVFCWIGNCANSSKKETVPFVSFGPIIPENGARAVLPIDLQAGAGWIQTFVSKDCKNPEKIAEVLSFATGREGLLLNEYGVENVDYTIDENGICTRTEDGAKRFTEVYNGNMAFWPFSNTDFVRSIEKPAGEDTDGGVWRQIATALGKYETTYIYDLGLLGFTGGTVIEPSSDLGIKLSQVDNYLESQKAKIVSAKSDEEFEAEYNNMITELENYQIADIDAEYNKVYQTYKEKYQETIEDVNAALFK